MELAITLNQTEVAMKIGQNGQTLDSGIFSYYHDLDDKLITGIDKLLESNNIDVTAIKDYKILGNTGEDATSRKIAEAFIEGLKIKIS